MANIQLTNYQVSDHSVTLSWRASNDLGGVFKSTELQTKYDSSVFMNWNIATYMFMTTILPCYAHVHRAPITLEIPSAVSEEMTSLIKEYLSLDLVKIISADRTVAATEQLPSANDASRYAIFYGGGKDSLLSAAIHGDLYGPENVTLLRLVWDTDLSNLPKKKKIIAESLDFMKDRGFQYEYVESNFHSIIQTRDIGKVANIALYPGLMCPLLAKRKYSQLAHGCDASVFHLPANPRGNMPFGLVRPENLKKLANALSVAIGSRTTFKNLNYGFNPGVAFKFLARSYRQYLGNLYMCERLSGKWCLKCRKCFLYALASIANKEPCDFNLGYYFQNSEYVKALVTEIQDAFSEGYGEIKHVYKFADKNHICSTVEIAHDVDLNYAREKLWHPKYPDAFLNFVRIIEPFRNFSYPEHHMFWQRAYEADCRELSTDQQGKDLAKILQRLEQAKIPVSESYQFEGLRGEIPVSYRYSAY